MSHSHEEEGHELSEMNLEVVTYLGYEIKIYTPQHACSVCPDCAEERHELEHEHEEEHGHDHDLHCNHHCPYDHECPHCHTPHNCIDKHVCPENKECAFCHEGHVMPAALIVLGERKMHLEYNVKTKKYHTHALYGVFDTPLDVAKAAIHYSQQIPR